MYYLTENRAPSYQSRFILSHARLLASTTFFFCWFAERMLCFFGYGIFPELGLPRLDVVNQPGHARSGWIAGYFFFVFFAISSHSMQRRRRKFITTKACLLFCCLAVLQFCMVLSGNTRNITLHPLCMVCFQQAPRGGRSRACHKN